MKTILMATDGSDPAEQALDVAIDLARDTGAVLEVLTVRPPLPVGHGARGPAVQEVEEPHGAEHIADTGAQRARAAGVEAKAHTIHGDVVDCIADTATSLGADLLVVGSRGLGPLSGAMLGSVSHALVRRSPVPITIVRHAAVHASAAS